MNEEAYQLEKIVATSCDGEYEVIKSSIRVISKDELDAVQRRPPG